MMAGTANSTTYSTSNRQRRCVAAENRPIGRINKWLMKVQMMWGLAAVVQRVTLFQEKWVNPERFYTREWQELKSSIL